MYTKSTANKTERLVMTALMMSLILIGTLVIRIPVPMSQGYVHMGDAMIYIAAFMLGRKNAAAAAGIGSAMADILGGFAVWAPWSLLIKAVMAYICSTLTGRASSDNAGTSRTIIAESAGMAAGGIVMCAGYFIAEWVMYGSWQSALIGVPWNIGQFAAGIAVSMSFIHAFRNVLRSR